MTSSDRDTLYMKEALRLAVKGMGRTSPNPMVGAVVVHGDTIVGSGYHEQVGGPHAEVNALRSAGDKSKGAELYVTLEPCNHYGRTPPCTKAVLESGISRVVVGMSDPNPGVQGGGADFLRSQGIHVDTGVLETPCRLINQSFIKHSTTGIPFVTLKAAATLDGRIASRTGDSRWVTNERSRQFVHQLRCSLDGILVGIGTILADDPMLNARLKRRVPCRQPIRIVLDSHLRIPVTAQLVQTAKGIPTWVACSEEASTAKERALEDAGVEILRFSGSNERVDLRSLLQELGRRQITSILVEGGARVHGAFLEEQLADSFYFFYAPKILGDPEAIPMVHGVGRERMSDSLRAYNLHMRRFGDDVMLSGRLRESPY